MVIHTYVEEDPEHPVGSPDTGVFDVLSTTGNERVLEIGCGPGRHAYALSKCVKFILAVDIQGYMICHATKHYSRDNIEFSNVDFFDLELRDCEFDIIVAQNVFYHIEKKDECLRRVYDALKRGGQFAFTDLTEHIIVEDAKGLSFPVQASFYTQKLHEVGFTNIQFFWEKSWVEDGSYIGKNYCLFKCSK